MKDRAKDDQQMDRILTRREVLAVLSAAGSGVLSSVAEASSGESALSRCIGRPAQTEGPYFLDTNLNRSDIRSDPSDGSVSGGVPLSLEFRVSQLTRQGCGPLSGAVVDVWHCDARGIYSGVRDPHFNTLGRKFLRGYQVTDDAGTARFTTIFPGWYPGRTVHIHFKIRIDPSSKAGYEFTSQLYFDDSVADQVFAQSPYSSRGRRTMHNRDDHIFRAGGDQLVLDVKRDGVGYATAFDIGLQRM
jgi:protocatechuate 3,4-dioxygenase beta subunit